MKMFNAEVVDFNIIALNENIPQTTLYPYFRRDKGPRHMAIVSPQHGRSYVVHQPISPDDGRYIVSNGNGLSYTTQTIIITPEQTYDIFGLLAKDDALRDFNVGMEIAELGIKTNIMEAVLELNMDVVGHNSQIIHPYLLQYSVESPYRISDAAFMTKDTIRKYVEKWNSLDEWNCDASYKIAAHVLIRNLRILHDNQILHNAFSSQNLTWALELLDFELAYTPSIPYTKEDYCRHVPDLYDREVMYIYQIILDIAWILQEDVDYGFLDGLFAYYGFKLSNFR